MTAHLLILYPTPKDPTTFDRAYRTEHLPYAGPRLKGALGVTTKRVVGPAFAPPPYHLMSDVSFPILTRSKPARRPPAARKHSSMPPRSALAALPPYWW